MSYEKTRSDIHKSLLPLEKKQRKKSVYNLVEYTCSYLPSELKIYRASLFGSLGREEGFDDSDGDIAIWSEIPVPSIKDYKMLNAQLIQTVNRCRDILHLEVIVNPFFVYGPWFEAGSDCYLKPKVIEAIKNEGILIWQK